MKKIIAAAALAALMASPAQAEPVEMFVTETRDGSRVFMEIDAGNLPVAADNKISVTFVFYDNEYAARFDKRLLVTCDIDGGRIYSNDGTWRWIDGGGRTYDKVGKAACTLHGYMMGAK